ncbi:MULTISPECIES: 30S ribosomal protein S6 [Anaerococcus]|jgi:ribosomal protein S6|uniref:Small ribosomal subunit protein bS6 n=1 Tax=Anaerococcus octavius TaxID=54007 RepID=A0A2I1M3U1_9FIRM|nr:MULTISPECIES: 30S ribosomal protein S6 [Anaerococcus]MDU2132766.1 30S ribosomal protein S6 [Finegoldia magna]MBS6106661.1 30S ribosomal protein S6 [Anaerococcus sp.]MDU0893775.1 30S ribosomal protein S6 [Anaerococcus sp.]MDU2599417.1 30S ribosomal protein S6 [Anaerococcus sp.]MDU3177259.1 30S ribosomal protein S6 [Anaerococcus sp.]
MNNYEAVLIFKADMQDADRTALLERFKTIISENGEVTDVDDWGKRRLAYEINDLKEGYYYIVNFKSQPDHISEFERRLRLSDFIIRYMVIRKED